MSKDRFETVIDKFVVDTEEKLLNVTRTALSALVEEMQTPVAKGGKLRVKTGFLRSTGIPSLNAMPVGPSKGDKNKTYVWSGDDIEVILSRMKSGDHFFFGWTAQYAPVRETYDGFIISAIKNWQKHVDDAVRKLKK